MIFLYAAFGPGCPLLLLTGQKEQADRVRTRLTGQNTGVPSWVSFQLLTAKSAGSSVPLPVT
jgi:hypothetical protein